ncbi:MAG: hypothetical protein ABIX46_04895 [Burkholderiaceae bacterium]
MKLLMAAGLALVAALPTLPLRAQPVDPASAAELRALRQQLDALRADYEGRLQALEARLRAAAATPVPAPVAAAAAPPPMQAPEPVPAPAPALAASPPPVGSANAFNPAISLILSGTYARSSRDPSTYAIRGFALPEGGEAGPGSRSFSLGESELGLSASVDPWWLGSASIAIHGDDTVSVEEAYVQTTALGNGLTLKAGRYLSNIGYLNPKHAHTWDFVDNPLAYQALLGTQFGDDGLQLRWLVPTEQYLELGAEIGRGRGAPANDGGTGGRNGAGAWTLTAHTGGDIGESHNWRAGLSLLNARATGLGLVDVDALGDSVLNAYTGTSRVWIADAVWKWAPGGNAQRTNLTLQGEYLRSRRRGSLVYDVGGADSAGDYRATASGWYLQGVYQFMPRWRVGLRTEQLDAGQADFGANNGVLSAVAFQPRKHSLMVDFNASEFSRLRLQFALDRAREGAGDRQLVLQYQMSLGAHGAHGY